MHPVMNILVACNVSDLATTIFEPDCRHFVEAVLIKAVLIDHNMHETELNHHVTMAHNVSHVIVPHVILLQAPLSLITTSLPGVLWPACLFWQLRPTCLIWQLHVPIWGSPHWMALKLADMARLGIVSYIEPITGGDPHLVWPHLAYLPNLG